MQKFSTACPRNCYSTCSFYVHVEDGKVINVEPHPQNKATPEGICLKGLAYVERANSPDRLLYPLKKNKKTGEFERISWPEVFETLSEKLNYFKEKHGPQSILFYAASGTSGMLNGVSNSFWKLFGGCTTMYGNLCWPAGLEAVRLTLGDNKHNAPWDLVHAKLIIFWGKNPAETNVQQMAFVEEAKENGCRVVVVDPRRTQTAETAELLVQPRPGTDAVLALAIANELIRRDWIDKEFIDEHVLGFDVFKRNAKKYSIQKAVDVCGISEEFIEKLIVLMGNFKPMTIMPGYGMQRFSNGGQTIRAILAIQVITGNIGKPGGNFHYANLQSYIFDEVKEPMSYYPPEKLDGIFRRSISMATLGSDMLTTKNPELKMIWVERGNPVAQNPDTNTILKAFNKLEFKVVVDQFMTDTAEEADLVLPAKNMFEQTDIIGSYWNPYVQLKQKVVEPAAEVKPETEIYWHLGLALGYYKKDLRKAMPEPGDLAVERWLKRILREKSGIKWADLKKGPQIADGHENIVYADYKFNTPSGKIELTSEQAKKQWGVNKLPGFSQLKEHEENAGFPLYLMTPNTKNRIHSQFNNLDVIGQFGHETTVHINPFDAKKRGVKHESYARVLNHRGSLKARVIFDYGLRLGCVWITNGWWIKQGGTPNFLSKGRETDMGHGTAFHDCMVDVTPIEHLK